MGNSTTEMFISSDIDDLLNGLDEDECQELVRLIRSLNQLATDQETGDPKYSEAQIYLIGRFRDLDVVEDDAEDDVEDDEDDADDPLDTLSGSVKPVI